MAGKNRIIAVKFCNGDCNHCAVIRNRQVSLLMNTLLHIYGDDIEEIGNAICPNLCCCADCHIDDYCHIGDDAGKSLCAIDKVSHRLARAFKRKFKKDGK